MKRMSTTKGENRGAHEREIVRYEKRRAQKKEEGASGESEREVSIYCFVLSGVVNWWELR